MNFDWEPLSHSWTNNAAHVTKTWANHQNHMDSISLNSALSESTVATEQHTANHQHAEAL